MKYSPYEASIPVFIYYLETLVTLIEKSERYAKKKKIDGKMLAEAQLVADQHNFIKQVQYVYFMAFEAASRLSGVAYPQFAYDEKNLKDCKVSIKKAILFLKNKKLRSVKSPSVKVESYLLPKGKKVALAHYITYIAVPNFFFHYTTAYDILRVKGVPIGKNDFLGIK